MARLLRQLLLVLTAFAFMSGTPYGLARAAMSTAPMITAPMTMAGMPGGMAMAHAAKPDRTPAAPCKGMMSGCRQMGCCAAALVPARMPGLEIAVEFGDAAYWPAGVTLADLVREPEPLPPRTI